MSFCSVTAGIWKTAGIHPRRISESGYDRKCTGGFCPVWSATGTNRTKRQTGRTWETALHRNRFYFFWWKDWRLFYRRPPGHYKSVWQPEGTGICNCPGTGKWKKRLFFSTVFPEQLQIFCAWQEKAPLNRTDSAWMKYIPLFFYGFRWNIETSYYEQKTFWSLCSYMVRSRSGIERMVNLINIAYCAMKILPYQDKRFSKYKGCGVQEFRFALSEEIRQQIFFTGFVKTVENGIKSQRILRVLKQLIYHQGYHL